MTWKFVDFNKAFDRSKFDCGEAVLNTYLKTMISRDVERKANVPLYAINANDEVVGFYTLSTSSIEFNNFPPNLKNKIAPYPVSVALIGRLAVDNSMKGKGLGKELLFHAVDRAIRISKEIGMRAIVVDAKNPSAEDFYKKYGFELLITVTVTYPRKMFLIV
ncbi:MAG: GNAT family N-acetyltransferase [Bacteriovorax sp.]|nr:GNAT family N-acetyltransferase [Bacteriovorax sp.]